MASDTKKHIKTRTHAIQFQFVVISAPNGAGTVKGGFTIILGIMFKAVKIYTIIVLTTGTSINGTARRGFITMGAPNIIGSFILKIPGSIESFPSCFRYCDFDVIKSTTSARVPPVPPICAYH